MMKKFAYFLFGSICICFVLSRCGIQREMERDVAEVSAYASEVVPAEDLEETKATYLRGYHLFKEVCSDCHGTSTKGRDTIPEFTMFQLDNYQDAAKKGSTENHAVLKKLSPEQVSDVMTFLICRTLAKQARRNEGK